MASTIILSDNGVSSGSAGIKTTGGNDGTLLLQTTTAGGTATTAMTIDTSQNVGMGTASPTYKLQVKGDNSAAGGILLQGTAGSYGLQIYHNGPADTSYIYNYYSGPMLFGTNNTERMRLDANGNLGIGQTSMSSDTRLHLTKTTDNCIAKIQSSYGAELQLINGGGSEVSVINATGNNVLSLRTGSTERARIDASGNLLVGTTNSNGQLTVYSSATSNNVAFLRATSTSFAGEICVVGCDRNTTNGTFNAFSYYNYAASQYRFKVLDSGNVQNSNNSYGAISDIKLKENITDATPKLEQLTQVRVVNYNFIGDEQKQLGVIAQELEQVFPGMVEETVDRDQEGNDLGTTTKSVKYSVFVPMLIKAIQEQQAIIQQLQADVAALKGQA